MSQEQGYENTDRELWREKPGDAYAPSIHVTKDGGIGINAGGRVMVLTLRKWFELANDRLNELDRRTPDASRDFKVIRNKIRLTKIKLL